MPAGVAVPDRVVEHIGVPIKRGRLPRLGDDAVGLDEVSRQRVIVARDIVVKSQYSLVQLASIPARQKPQCVGFDKLSRRMYAFPGSGMMLSAWASCRWILRV